MSQAEIKHKETIKSKRRRDPDIETQACNEVGSVHNPYTVSAFTNFAITPLDSVFFDSIKQNTAITVPMFDKDMQALRGKESILGRGFVLRKPDAKHGSTEVFSHHATPLASEEVEAFDQSAEEERNNVFSLRTEKLFLQNQLQMIHGKQNDAAADDLQVNDAAADDLQVVKLLNVQLQDFTNVYCKNLIHSVMDNFVYGNFHHCSDVLRIYEMEKMYCAENKSYLIYTTHLRKYLLDCYPNCSSDLRFFSYEDVPMDHVLIDHAKSHIQSMILQANQFNDVAGNVVVHDICSNIKTYSDVIYHYACDLGSLPNE